MTHWTPPTWADSYDTDKRVPCDRCDREVWPWILQDMRSLPDVGGDWLCDSCRSDMKRNLISVDGDQPPFTRKEWTERLMKAHGAPEEVLEKIRALRLQGFERTMLEKTNPSGRNGL